MNRHRRLIAGAVLLATLAFGTAARAEVSAELDALGNYLRTVVLTSGSVKNVKIWTSLRPRAGFVALNPTGDLNGDLWPATAGPWVVWSRFNGADFDLAWAHWGAVRWNDVAWLENVSGTASDDLDPNLALDPGGRPFVAWWRAGTGGGRVYLSLFLSTRWMTAYPISDAGVDSRHPVIVALDGHSIRVDYLTPTGPATRIVTFNRPGSITDDLNPFASMTVTDPSASGGSSQFSK